VIGQLQHVPPHVHHSIAPMPGVRVRVTERCTGCGVCTQGVCFTSAITVPNGRAAISGLCVACGRCIEACPNQALELCVDDEGYVEATIRRLERRVDVR
jgi:ferredoxin